jgi:hypothetical protein
MINFFLGFSGGGSDSTAQEKEKGDLKSTSNLFFWACNHSIQIISF